jgi:hypothetical protein
MQNNTHIYIYIYMYLEEEKDCYLSHTHTSGSAISDRPIQNSSGGEGIPLVIASRNSEAGEASGKPYLECVCVCAFRKRENKNKVDGGLIS